MKVLVLGGLGYVGSALCEKLDDFEVYDLKQGQDIRNVRPTMFALEKADAIVHLAGTSMDPLMDRDPEFTWETNYLANDMIAKLLRNTGKRVIYASSGSVYGSQAGVCTEDGSVQPITLYGKTKHLSEELFLHKDLNSIVFRFATCYGPAPFTRYDTVINGMTKSAFENKKLTISGKDKRRSVCHIQDIVSGILLALTVENPPYRLYNLGSNDQNLSIEEIGKKVAAVTGVEMVYKDSDNDNRSYTINYDRVKELGFETKHTIEEAVKELYERFQRS
jgi:nucleoside-diphosphate-sugar epimerase